MKWFDTFNIYFYVIKTVRHVIVRSSIKSIYVLVTMYLNKVYILSEKQTNHKLMQLFYFVFI